MGTEGGTIDDKDPIDPCWPNAEGPCGCWCWNALWMLDIDPCDASPCTAVCLLTPTFVVNPPGHPTGDISLCMDCMGIGCIG